jgi:uncharacterized protein with HEPN domain
MMKYCSSIITRSKTVINNYGELTPDTDIFKAFAFDLLQLGELAGIVDNEFKKEHSEIAWIDIKGVRNRMAHDYEGVNLNIFWDIIFNDIPSLHKQLSGL